LKGGPKNILQLIIAEYSVAVEPNSPALGEAVVGCARERGIGVDSVTDKDAEPDNGI
jgi:hypothetical protein